MKGKSSFTTFFKVKKKPKKTRQSFLDDRRKKK